jgi:hypothetical protein
LRPSPSLIEECIENHLNKSNFGESKLDIYGPKRIGQLDVTIQHKFLNNCLNNRNYSRIVNYLDKGLLDPVRALAYLASEGSEESINIILPRLENSSDNCLSEILSASLKSQTSKNFFTLSLAIGTERFIHKILGYFVDNDLGRASFHIHPNVIEIYSGKYNYSICIDKLIEGYKTCPKPVEAYLSLKHLFRFVNKDLDIGAKNMKLCGKLSEMAIKLSRIDLELFSLLYENFPIFIEFPFLDIVSSPKTLLSVIHYMIYVMKQENIKLPLLGPIAINHSSERWNLFVQEGLVSRDGSNLYSID